MSAIAHEISQLQEENNRLRGMLANGNGACIHCGLAAEDIAACKSGFPGCARMDDISMSHETEKEARLNGIIERHAEKMFDASQQLAAVIDAIDIAVQGMKKMNDIFSQR